MLMVSIVPMVLTSFKDEMTHASDADLSEMWDNFVPGVDGFIEVQNPEQYGLPQGMTTKLSNGVHNVYGLSWTHQFHCLVSSVALAVVSPPERVDGRASVILVGRLLIEAEYPPPLFH